MSASVANEGVTRRLGMVPVDDAGAEKLKASTECRGP